MHVTDERLSKVICCLTSHCLVLFLSSQKEMFTFQIIYVTIVHPLKYISYE
jgi:hypothetical protein